MQGQETYHLKITVPCYEPQEVFDHALRTLRSEASQKIFGILFERKLPAVVDIEERVVDEWDSKSLYIRITITPVQYRNVVMPSFREPLRYIPTQETKMGFAAFSKKVRSWFSGKVKNR